MDMRIGRFMGDLLSATRKGGSSSSPGSLPNVQLNDLFGKLADTDFKTSLQNKYPNLNAEVNLSKLVDDMAEIINTKGWNALDADGLAGFIRDVDGIANTFREKLITSGADGLRNWQRVCRQMTKDLDPETWDRLLRQNRDGGYYEGAADQDNFKRYDKVRNRIGASEDRFSDVLRKYKDLDNPDLSTPAAKSRLTKAFLYLISGIGLFNLLAGATAGYCIHESVDAQRKYKECKARCTPPFRIAFAYDPTAASGDHLHYWALDTAQHWNTVPTESHGAALCTYANLKTLRQDGTIDDMPDLKMPDRKKGQVYSATCDDFCRASCGRLKKTVGECVGQQARQAAETAVDVVVPVAQAAVDAFGDVAEEVGTTIGDFFSDVVDGTGWVLFVVLAVLILLLVM